MKKSSGPSSKKDELLYKGKRITIASDYSKTTYKGRQP